MSLKYGFEVHDNLYEIYFQFHNKQVIVSHFHVFTNSFHSFFVIAQPIEFWTLFSQQLIEFRIVPVSHYHFLLTSKRVL